MRKQEREEKDDTQRGKKERENGKKKTERKRGINHEEREGKRWMVMDAWDDDEKRKEKGEKGNRNRAEKDEENETMKKKGTHKET